MLHGNDLIIKLDGTAIASCKSCDITVSADTISVSSATNGQYEAAEPTRTSWKVSASTLISDVTDMLKAGTTYTLAFTYRKNGVKVSGQAICTQCKMTATRGSLAQGSIEFLGTGPLE